MAHHIGKRVLLVEDEENIREAISFLLSREGWQVHTHSDGASAFSLIRELKPDLVILDYMLPGQNGLEILAQIRQEPMLPHLPILMLTARGQARDREQAEKAGVSRFMTKPFSNSQVITAVRDLVYMAELENKRLSGDE